MPTDATKPLDEESLLALEPYEVIDNRAVGQVYRLLEHDSDADGEYFRYEIKYRPDATGFAEHLHPIAEEAFKVVSGELVVTMNGTERSLGPGEQVRLPPGTPHTHLNASGIESRVLSEVRPPLATEALIRWLAEMAKEGNTDAEGTPNLLPLAAFIAANPDLVYLSSPPVLLQQLLFKLLAPIGRLRGHPTDFPPDRS